MPLLECMGLVRRFGALVAVDAVDMSLDAGKIRAVIGPNGAGKSTVFNLITSVLKPTAGEVIFAGEKITGLPVHVVAQKGIARTFQLCHIFPALTARENVRIAAQARDAQGWRFVGGGRVRNRSAAIADEALEHMRLTRFAGVAAAMLSHGDQRLLEVAMAIAQKPRLLMLDEPTQAFRSRRPIAPCRFSRACSALEISACSWSSTTWKWCSSSPTTSRFCIAAA